MKLTGLKHLPGYPALFLFFAMAALLLLQIPLKGSLPGNWDTWLYLSLFNYYPDYLYALLTGSWVYKPFFPESLPPFVFGEPSFFNALIYLPLQWITGSQLWGFYLFVSIILALNAWGMYLLVWEGTGSLVAALVAGSMLMTTNYMLSGLDQQNVLSIYPALLCLLFALKYYRKGRSTQIILAAIFASLQLYCSGYHFFFLFIVCSVVVLFYFRDILGWRHKKAPWVAMLLVITLAIPYALVYLFGNLTALAINPIDADKLSSLSLRWPDLFTAHPYNVLYGKHTDESLMHYIHSASPGFLLPLLGVFGLRLLPPKHFWLLVAMIATGFILATGPVWHLGGVRVHSPLYLFLNFLGIDNFLRTPVRAYIIVLCTLIWPASLFVSTCLSKWKFIWIPLLLIWLLENVPFKLQYYNSTSYLHAPEDILSATKQLPEDAVLLLQPTSISSDAGLPVGMGEVNREYIYMYWQTQFKRSMVNGMNGYMPYSNIELRQKLGTVLTPGEKGPVQIDYDKRIDTILYLPIMDYTFTK